MRAPAIAVSILTLVLAASCGPKAGRVELLSEAKAPDGSYITWKEHLLDGEEMGLVPIRGAAGLQMADIDRDGFLDIVSAHRDSSHIRLAFGTKSPGEWFLLTLGEGSAAPAVRDVAVGDLNGDGFPDAVAACANGQLVYFQNPGGKVRGWPWPRNVIPVAGRSSFVRVFLADINRDGRPEVIAANEGTGAEDGPISWFEAPRDPMDGAAWREHELIRVRTPTNCYPVDIDGDGDLDIFVGSRGERLVVWLENLGGAPVSFRNHAISLAGSGLEIDGSSVAFHDFNGDRRLDVVTTTIEKSVVWLEQPEDPAAPWKPHQIGTLLPDEPAGLAVADINGDRRPDVMVGSRSRGPTETDGVKVSAADPVGRLAWFECPENPSGIWKRNDILRLKRGSYEAFVPRDLDRDGDADFIATRGNSGEYDGVFWLEQVRSKKTKTFTAVRQSESERLPIPVSESK